MRVFKFVWIASFVLIGFTLCAEEAAETIERKESDNAVTVQPNGYFAFTVEDRLNEEVVTYGELVDVISELTAEQLEAFQNKKSSQVDATKMTASESNDETASNPAERKWKRRILVLLDGERVTGTADRNMKIEEHVGISLDSIESLEGFLATDADSSKIAYPRVLNFVTKPSILNESNNVPESRESSIDELDENHPQTRTQNKQQS